MFGFRKGGYHWLQNQEIYEGVQVAMMRKCSDFQDSEQVRKWAFLKSTGLNIRQFGLKSKPPSI